MEGVEILSEADGPSGCRGPRLAKRRAAGAARAKKPQFAPSAPCQLSVADIAHIRCGAGGRAFADGPAKPGRPSEEDARSLVRKMAKGAAICEPKPSRHNRA